MKWLGHNRLLSVVGAAILALAAGAGAADAAVPLRLKDFAHIKEVRSNQLYGIGLVVGLNGTGDSEMLADQLVTNMLQRLHITMVNTNITSKNVAAVIVTAEAPPFMMEGSKFDVTVSCLGSATSLVGRNAAADAAPGRRRPGLRHRAGAAPDRRLCRGGRGGQGEEEPSHRRPNPRRRDPRETHRDRASADRRPADRAEHARLHHGGPRRPGHLRRVPRLGHAGGRRRDPGARAAGVSLGRETRRLRGQGRGGQSHCRTPRAASW